MPFGQWKNNKFNVIEELKKYPEGVKLQSPGQRPG